MCIRDRSQAQETFKGIAIEIHNLEEAIEAGKNEIIEILNQRASIKAVSYTHLDVYKRQHQI